MATLDLSNAPYDVRRAEWHMYTYVQKSLL